MRALHMPDLTEEQLTDWLFITLSSVNRSTRTRSPDSATKKKAAASFPFQIPAPFRFVSASPLCHPSNNLTQTSLTWNQQSRILMSEGGSAS